MNRTLRRFWIGIGATAYVVLCSLGAGSCNPGIGVGANGTCLQCHNGQLSVDVSDFPDSQHDFITCVRCHGDGTAHVRNGGRGGLYIQNPEDLPFETEFQVCTTCHETEPAQYQESGHFTEMAASCYDCHDIHKPTGLVLPAVDNTLCLSCHAEMGMATPAAIEAHTHHSVDPAGTGASRCIACHMPPLEVGGDETEHTLQTVQPIVSALAAEAAQTIPPNSCAATDGCHDGSSTGEPVFNLNDPAQMRILQTIYETWFPQAADQ